MSRRMKDSGIEWIGEIPEGWILTKLLRLLSMPVTDGPHETPEFLDDGIPFISAEAIKNNKIDFEKKRGYISEEANEIYSKKYKPLIHDIYIIKSGATTGNMAIVETEGIFNIWSPLAVVRTNEENDYRFIYYSMYSDSFQEQIRQSWTYGTQQNLGMRKLEQLILSRPGLEEQRKISSYLEKKAVQIDQTIEKQKQIVEKLKEYKQSIITEAITKGLNPNVKMKDSGIEWIEEIPEHWEIKKFKKVFTTQKGLPITKDNLIETGVPVISYGQIHSKSNNGTEICSDLIRFVDEYYYKTNYESLAHYGDFLFADTSEDLEGAGNYAFIDKNENIFAGYHTIIARPNDVNNPKYLAYLFKANCWRSQIRSRVSGIKLYSITQKILMSNTLIMPTDNEQDSIVEYLDNIIKKVDLCIKRKETIIDKLEAYKKSLIYECVTGKREVK